METTDARNSDWSVKFAVSLDLIKMSILQNQVFVGDIVDTKWRGSME